MGIVSRHSPTFTVLYSLTHKPYARGPTDTGMSRLSLSDSDKEARDWFVGTTKALGCEVTIDQMGNIFAVRPGRRQDIAPIFAGSHLDTQPAAGRYDGILGILAGIEMLKVLQDNQVETEHPVGVVNWTKYEAPLSNSCLPRNRPHSEVPNSVCIAVRKGPGSQSRWSPLEYGLRRCL
jgi:hypothetical protein